MVKSKVDRHFAKKNQTKDKSNSRSVTADNTEVSEQKQNEFHGKALPQEAQSQADVSVQVVEAVAGAYYLPVLVNIQEAWDKVTDAMNSMNSLDTAQDEEDEFSAFGLQYYRDSFMLARTKICQVQGRGENSFLELRRLEGCGFVFADQFKKQLVGDLAGVVEDVAEVDPVALEEQTEPSLQYLDLSDEQNAEDIINMWLNDLRPSGGVQYDQTRIYEAISALAWNATCENNFKVLSEYSDSIIVPVLQILAHEETTFVPTVYFASQVLNLFASSFPEESLNWHTAASLCSAMKRFGLQNEGASLAKQQVTSSREVANLLFKTLTALAPSLKDRDDESAQVVSDVVAQMPNMFSDKSEAIASLSQTLGL